mgnify:CR=1 FL=1
MNWYAGEALESWGKKELAMGGGESKVGKFLKQKKEDQNQLYWLADKSGKQKQNKKIPGQSPLTAGYGWG